MSDASCSFEMGIIPGQISTGWLSGIIFKENEEKGDNFKLKKGINLFCIHYDNNGKQTPHKEICKKSKHQ
jgi:hypothetical protein